MKRPLLVVSLVFFISGISWTIFGHLKLAASETANNAVFGRGAIQDEARKLLKQGKFDEALLRYKEALRPEYIIYEYDKAVAKGNIAHIYYLKGEFQKALEELNWFVLNSVEKKATPIVLEQIEEIQSLISYQDTGDSKSVTQFIASYKQFHKQESPPFSLSAGSDKLNSTILRLYDTIGDYDAGVAYMDQILEYMYREHPEIKRPSSSEEALLLSQENKSIRGRQNRRGYEVIAEHLKVREAFLQDKAEGKKGSMKEGKPGRATMALIQSDYFPW